MIQAAGTDVILFLTLTYAAPIWIGVIAIVFLYGVSEWYFYENKIYIHNIVWQVDQEK